MLFVYLWNIILFYVYTLIITTSVTMNTCVIISNVNKHLFNSEKPFIVTANQIHNIQHHCNIRNSSPVYIYMIFYFHRSLYIMQLNGLNSLVGNVFLNNIRINCITPSEIHSIRLQTIPFMPSCNNIQIHKYSYHVLHLNISVLSELTQIFMCKL